MQSPKNLFAVLTLTLTSTLTLTLSLTAALCLTQQTLAMAQTTPTVTLDGSQASVNGAEAIVVRTAQTPDKVTLRMVIPFGQTVCERYDTRMVFGQDPSCGYDTQYYNRRVCETRRVCQVAKDGVCQSYRSETSCRDILEPVTVMRSCYHPETYCSQRGIAHDARTEKVVLDFKGLDALIGDQQEKFLILGRQNHTDGINDKYTASVIDSPRQRIEVRETDFLGDRIRFRKAD